MREDRIAIYINWTEKKVSFSQDVDMWDGMNPVSTPKALILGQLLAPHITELMTKTEEELMELSLELMEKQRHEKNSE